MAVIYLFYIDRVDWAPPFLRLWGLRFLGLTLASFCLGLAFRNAYLKAAMFSLLAVFAALGFGESYLAYMDAKTRGADSAKAVVAPEFAEEVLHSLDLYADETRPQADGGGVGIQEAQATGYMVRDLDEAKSIFSSQGITVARDAVTTAGANQPDLKLGYRPIKKAAQILAIKKSRSNLIYSAIYNLSPEGWRVTPQHPGATEAVVFLGCSLTFGEGLNDEDTFPWKTGELLGDRYQVFNFSDSGYGTHQIMAMIDNGYLDAIAAKYDKMHVFYLTIPAHALRNAGQSPWDQDGPAYRMTPDGAVEFKGTFREVRKLEGQSQNLLLAKLSEDKYVKDLHVALIRQADKVLREKYQTGLTVIEVFTDEKYLEPLESDQIDILKLLPNPLPEHTIRGDGHPSAKATTIIAEEIVEYIKKGSLSP